VARSAPGLDRDRRDLAGLCEIARRIGFAPHVTSFEFLVTLVIPGAIRLVE